MVLKVQLVFCSLTRFFFRYEMFVLRTHEHPHLANERANPWDSAHLSMLLNQIINDVELPVIGRGRCSHEEVGVGVNNNSYQVLSWTWKHGRGSLATFVRAAGRLEEGIFWTAWNSEILEKMLSTKSVPASHPPKGLFLRKKRLSASAAAFTNGASLSANWIFETYTQASLSIPILDSCILTWATWDLFRLCESKWRRWGTLRNNIFRWPSWRIATDSQVDERYGRTDEQPRIKKTLTSENPRNPEIFKVTRPK